MIREYAVGKMQESLHGKMGSAYNRNVLQYKNIPTMSFSFFVPTTFSSFLYREFRLVGIERHVLYFVCYLSGMSGLKWNGSEPV